MIANIRDLAHRGAVAAELLGDHCAQQPLRADGLKGLSGKTRLGVDAFRIESSDRRRGMRALPERGFTCGVAFDSSGDFYSVQHSHRLAPFAI